MRLRGSFPYAIRHLSISNIIKKEVETMQCGDYGYRAVENGAEIIEYHGQGGEISLPETLDDLPVTSVGLCAFIMRADLTAVTLPGTIRHIGGSAFEGCTALVKVMMPDGLESVEYRAFAACTALTAVDFPDSVTALGGGVLAGCTSLRSVHLPAGLTVLPMQALMGCTALETLTLPDSLTRIDHEALRGCTHLTALTVPDGVREIGHDALTGCARLETLTLPDALHRHERDLRVGLGLMMEGETLIVGSYLGQAERGGTYSVIEYIGSDTELIIPAMIEGCRVTKFNQRILEDMDNLQILSIPAGFTVEPSLLPEGTRVVVRHAQEGGTK